MLLISFLRNKHECALFTLMKTFLVIPQFLRLLKSSSVTSTHRKKALCFKDNKQNTINLSHRTFFPLYQMSFLSRTNQKNDYQKPACLRVYSALAFKFKNKEKQPLAEVHPKRSDSCLWSSLTPQTRLQSCFTYRWMPPRCVTAKGFEGVGINWEVSF